MRASVCVFNGSRDSKNMGTNIIEADSISLCLCLCRCVFMYVYVHAMWVPVLIAPAFRCRLICRCSSNDILSTRH